VSEGPNAALAPPPVKTRRTAQAWIESIADDPEAVSAFVVARRTLAAGAALTGLRRLRLIEIEGALPDAGSLAARLHDSTRFYNPNKERCHLRVIETDAAPLAAGEAAALVFDRDGERRLASERWWKRVTGGAAKVREGTAWIASAAPGHSALEVLADLLEVRDARHGLLCNPNAQEFRGPVTAVPFRWFASRAASGRKR
jgi:hypothetical protein